MKKIKMIFLITLRMAPMLSYPFQWMPDHWQFNHGYKHPPDSEDLSLEHLLLYSLQMPFLEFGEYTIEFVLKNPKLSYDFYLDGATVLVSCEYSWRVSVTYVWDPNYSRADINSARLVQTKHDGTLDTKYEMVEDDDLRERLVDILTAFEPHKVYRTKNGNTIEMTTSVNDTAGHLSSIIEDLSWAIDYDAIQSALEGIDVMDPRAVAQFLCENTHLFDGVKPSCFWINGTQYATTVFE